MVAITYVENGGTEHTVETTVGETLMSAAVAKNVPGIDADCGGNCACATCHLYVTEALALQITEAEKDMLTIADNVTELSRLGCQIRVTDDLDGLIVRLPFAQH